MVSLPARGLFNGSLSAGVAQINLQPTNLNSVAGAAANYEFYRITKLRYRLYPNGGGSMLAAAYIAGAVDNAPSSPYDVAQTPHCVLYGDDVTVPTSWRNVPKSALASYNTWYKTVAGSPDPTEEVQGKIYLAGSSTDSYLLEYEMVYQFRTLVVTSATPAQRGAIELEKYRAQLLRVLGLAMVPSPLPPGNPSSGK